jgi:hypothetical protein
MLCRGLRGASRRRWQSALKVARPPHRPAACCRDHPAEVLGETTDQALSDIAELGGFRPTGRRSDNDLIGAQRRSDHHNRQNSSTAGTGHASARKHSPEGEHVVKLNSLYAACLELFHMMFQGFASGGPEVRRPRGPEAQRSRGPEVQRSRGPEVQRSRGPEVQRSRGPGVQAPPVFNRILKKARRRPTNAEGARSLGAPPARRHPPTIAPMM